MDSSTSPAVARLVARAKKDPDVLAVLLFGSRARGDAAPSSDFDVCLVLGAEPRSDLDRAEKRLEYLAEGDLDVAVFQSLPLYIRSRVLKEGTVLYARDEDALYAVAIRTARAWEGFRHIHRQYLDEVLVVDGDRVLAKLDELEGYLGELRAVAPDRFEAYQRTETKRACERLIQVSVEAVIDICALLVVGLRLGLPGEEDDLFERLSRHGAISGPMAATLRRIKGLRNLLVHEYGRINDELVFETVHGRLGDFDAFKDEVLAFLKR